MLSYKGYELNFSLYKSNITEKIDVLACSINEEAQDNACFMLSDFNSKTGRSEEDDHFLIGTQIGKGIKMTENFLAIHDTRHVNIYIR